MNWIWTLWPDERKLTPMKPKNIAQYGLLTALALVLAYLESLIPAFFAIPGMKLGLTNLVVLSALYQMGGRAALILNLIRIGLVTLLFGNGLAFLFSLAGGLLSWLVMVGLKASGRFSMLGVSMAGGVAHNVGQILMAMIVLDTWQVVSYLLVLWISGLAAGLVIGLLCYEVLRRLPKHLFSPEVHP